MYEGRNDVVSTHFYPGTKTRDSEEVYEFFSFDDAKAILATCVREQPVSDRILWSKSTDGMYNVKTGY